ncbi:hypothetical protein GF322_02200 [Candidatus Dependentiae bacterium]|nr:hypothetical protein [Candidatus Dependentiae bacterium]
MRYSIIDAIGPFIDPSNTPKNWSKVPFSFYENKKDLNVDFKRIINQFESFVQQIKKIGYNSITLDDLPHMVILDFYSTKDKQKISQFEQLYKKLIKISNKNNLKVFITFDLMYFNKEIEAHTQNKDNKIIEVLKNNLTTLFEKYDIEGVISRIGECDGIDVKGIFKSKITIKSPKQIKKYLTKLLPLFEKNNKKWIFRTWTIGGSKIGDLIWNKKTFSKVFKDINSPSLIISMKYGVSDFFRNMDLNPLFFLGNHKKIIELQTKREYDFFGEMPYYTGFDYEKYYNQLQNNEDLVGIMVWCQTGGWSESKKLTFLHNSSQFTELNTISAINIFKGKNAEEVKQYFNNPQMDIFFKKYNYLSERILYPKNHKELFLNKVFIPPIIWAYWGNITINKVTSSFVNLYYDPIEISDEEFIELKNSAIESGINDADFYIDTLKILYYCRKALHKEIEIEELNKRINIYKENYSLLNFNIAKNNSSFIIKNLCRIFIRKKKEYRLIDKLVLNRSLAILVKFYLLVNKNDKPSFVNQQAMPLTKIIS